MSHIHSNRNLNKLVASLMVAAMFAAAFFVTSPAAKADTSAPPVSGTATLSGAQLINLTTPLTFTGELTGKAQPDLTSTTFKADVSDTTNDTGWKLTASMTPLVTSGSVDLTTLPKITGATHASDIAIESIVNTLGEGDYESAIQLTGASKIIFASNKGTAEGQSTVITFNSSLAIPATTADGVYHSDLTLTLAPGVV